MRINYFLFLVFLSITLCSCGREDPGRIINDTDETVTMFLKLNYPGTKYCPDNYFREEIMLYKYSETDGHTTAGDYTVEFDSITNSAILKLLPGQKIDLGTVRLDADRNDYRSWEFKSITCKGDKGFRMHAEGPAIMEYVSKPLIPTGTYDFIIE